MDKVRFDKTDEGSAGTHEGSGEPHEGSGVFDRCCKKVKIFFLKRPKIMFSEKNNFFHLFDDNFQSPNERWD